MMKSAHHLMMRLTTLLYARIMTLRPATTTITTIEESQPLIMTTDFARITFTEVIHLRFLSIIHCFTTDSSPFD